MSIASPTQTARVQLRTIDQITQRKMTDAQDVEPQAHPTILTGRKEDISFEMWVEVDGKPLKVYGEAEMESGGSEAWIASEIGKVCFNRTVSYRSCPS